MDMSQFVIPKSDQLNADDLIAGPRTIRITRVAGTGNNDQPVSVYFDGDDGKPYKPCKGMRRVMIAGWGVDASQYVGRSMTLYRDPKVVFGGMEVGGIRISHMSHLDRPLAMALTVTKAKRAPYKVAQLVEQKTGVNGPTPSRAPAVDPATVDGNSTKGDPSAPETTGSGGGAQSKWLSGLDAPAKNRSRAITRPCEQRTRYFSPQEWVEVMDLLLTDADDDPFEVWTQNLTTHTELSRAATTEAFKLSLTRLADAAKKAIDATAVAMGGPGV